MIALRRKIMLLAFLTYALVLTGGGPAEAQEANRLGFGTDLGFVSGTANGTVFALNFNLDYYLDRDFSIGPMVQLTPIGDLTRIAIAGVARYHFRTGVVNIVPFAGLGLVHDDLNRGSGPGAVDRNDTSHYIPLGVTVEYPVSNKLSLANTLMIGLHDINLNPGGGTDQTSVSLLFGVRFGP